MALNTSQNNWAEFNGDLLNLVLSRVFGEDKLSFSLVCKHWNRVATTSSYRYSPCLVYYYWRTHTWKFYQYNTFFDIAFPHLENAEVRCSKYGWLLMSRHDDTLFFFDPSNNRKVELPVKVDELYYPLSFFNPPTSSECVVVGIRGISTENVKICILELGDDEWEYLVFSIDRPGEEFMMSLGAPVMHDGLIYFLSVKGDVAILDIKEETLDISFNCLFSNTDHMYYDIREQYLVKVNGEDALYGVFVFDDERQVNAFRLTSDTKWDLVESIGDKVFYVSHAVSFGNKARYKSMEDTICFPMFYDDVPVFYSMSDDKYHSINGSYSESNVYGLKRMNRAAWIMPMPVQEETTTMSWALASK